nr:MAG TPA: hypothetical protein [Caudoviricetes sp.]
MEPRNSFASGCQPRESGFFTSMHRKVWRIFGYSGREWANRIPFGGICPPSRNGF